MISERGDESQRILFLPQNPYDAQTARELFSEIGVEVIACDDLRALVEELKRGAGCLLLTTERLGEDDFKRLQCFVESQPAWSDLPILLVTRGETLNAPTSKLLEIANASLIDRPVRVKSLLSTVQSALRDRRRQYEIRRSIANRDSFLAMLGHELRNPLAAIVLALEELEENDASAPALGIIRRQSGNLERIVDDLLEVSRISRGTMSFDKRPVDAVEVVRETTAAFSQLAQKQDLAMRVTVPDEQNVVDGDSVRLQQALGNLLSNAVRYTPDGGTIEVDVRREGEQVVISVQDPGMGIPEEMLDRVFDLFAQAHGEFSRREGGLGLGLSLANSIVEAHDGQLTAESGGEGLGSRFSIRLPLSRAAAVDTPDAKRLDHAAHQPLRLLLVEDVDDLRTLFSQMLRLHGHAVDEAANGETALGAMEQGNYDAILLDIGLPDIDGYELARRIRRRRNDVLLIALTGYGRQQDREQAERAGFDSLLTKPVDWEALEDLFRQISY